MTQLETDLRTWMHERAGRVHASPKLIGADYHARRHAFRPRLLIGGGLAAGAGVLAVVLSLAGGASTAFAGWTSRPTTASRAQLASTEAYCTKNVPDQGLPLKLIDARGPFTFVVYSNDSSNDFCTVGPSFRNASGWTTSPPVSVPAGRLYLWAEHTTASAGHAYTFVIARAGDGVTAANLMLDDGTEVTATVQNGWAVAWWPGSRGLVRARLRTAAGSQKQAFPPSACALHNCKGGGSHGGMASGPGGG